MYSIRGVVVFSNLHSQKFDIPIELAQEYPNYNKTNGTNPNSVRNSEFEQKNEQKSSMFDENNNDKNNKNNKNDNNNDNIQQTNANDDPFTDYLPSCLVI